MQSDEYLVDDMFFLHHVTVVAGEEEEEERALEHQLEEVGEVPLRDQNEENVSPPLFLSTSTPDRVFRRVQTMIANTVLNDAMLAKKKQTADRGSRSCRPWWKQAVRSMHVAKWSRTNRMWKLNTVCRLLPADELQAVFRHAVAHGLRNIADCYANDLRINVDEGLLRMAIMNGMVFTAEHIWRRIRTRMRTGGLNLICSCNEWMVFAVVYRKTEMRDWLWRTILEDMWVELNFATMLTDIFRWPTHLRRADMEAFFQLCRGSSVMRTFEVARTKQVARLRSFMVNWLKSLAETGNVSIMNWVETRLVGPLAQHWPELSEQERRTLRDCPKATLRTFRWFEERGVQCNVARQASMLSEKFNVEYAQFLLERMSSDAPWKDHYWSLVYDVRKRLDVCVKNGWCDQWCALLPHLHVPVLSRWVIMGWMRESASTSFRGNHVRMLETLWQRWMAATATATADNDASSNDCVENLHVTRKFLAHAFDKVTSMLAPSARSTPSAGAVVDKLCCLCRCAVQYPDIGADWLPARLVAQCIEGCEGRIAPLRALLEVLEETKLGTMSTLSTLEWLQTAWKAKFYPLFCWLFQRGAKKGCLPRHLPMDAKQKWRQFVSLSQEKGMRDGSGGESSSGNNGGGVDLSSESGGVHAHKNNHRTFWPFLWRHRPEWFVMDQRSVAMLLQVSLQHKRRKNVEWLRRTFPPMIVVVQCENTRKLSIEFRPLLLDGTGCSSSSNGESWTVVTSDNSGGGTESCPAICAVCMTSTSDVALGCNHQFCQDCVHKWMRGSHVENRRRNSQSTCPLCRATIEDVAHIVSPQVVDNALRMLQCNVEQKR